MIIWIKLRQKFMS